LWPVWFGEASFRGCRNDTLGREAARAIVRRAVEVTPAVSRPWAEAAALLALGGSRPRVAGTPRGIEIAQLCLTICRTGVVLVVDLAGAENNSAALVHAAEWMARHAGAAVVVLVDAVPVHSTPLDRILHGARRIVPDVGTAPLALAENGAGEQPWLGPVRGKPHPLSETEQRLASLIARDAELSPLFAFNQLVDTVRGTRPKVDLVWADGRLVVELDGFADHGGRAAFMHDRNRDYELSLSGYSVLRIANDEVSQDIEKAVDKIRDMVRFCRMRQSRES
jgi:very-short-patch-repair endonuclease